MESTCDAAVIAAVRNAWNAGAHDWNSDRLADVYSPDALFFGGRPGHAVGRVAIRNYFASYCRIIRSSSVRFEELELRRLAPQTLLAQGFAAFDFVLSNGHQTHSRLRASWLLVEREGGWCILQHHISSSPAQPPLGG